MADETKISSITEIVNSEFIEPLIMDYAIDAMVAAPLCRVSNLAGKGTKVAAFARWDKDTGADITEGTAMSNNELTLSDVQVTAAQVGILREVTDFAAATSITGPEALMAFIAMDGGKLCGEMMEDDVVGLFPSATSSVGTSGQDLSVADFLQAIATLDTNKARGRRVCVLDDQQAFDLRAAVAASQGTVFGNSNTDQSVLVARGNGYVGELFGVPVWMSNLTETANAGADVVGAMFIDGNANPEMAALGIASVWTPKVKQQTSAANTSEIVGITQCYGAGLIHSSSIVKIVTDA